MNFKKNTDMSIGTFMLGITAFPLAVALNSIWALSIIKVLNLNIPNLDVEMKGRKSLGTNNILWNTKQIDKPQIKFHQNPSQLTPSS